MKLTSTNSLIGLIALIVHSHKFLKTIFHSFFIDLVAFAGFLHPFPFRTRPLNALAPMVLHLKMRESRSLPGL